MLFSCAIALLAAGTAAIGGEAASLPDKIYVSGARHAEIASKPHIKLISPGNEAASAALTVDNSYMATAMLFGLLPIKNIEVTRVSSEYVELGGRPVGIMLYSDGLIIAGLSPVDTENGYINPGELCGLEPGDVIKQINGSRAQNAQQLINAIEKSQGSNISLEVLDKDGRLKESELTPVYSCTDGMWRGGIWIKETSSGLGMLTFVTADSYCFGGLGHAICDAESGSAVSIYGGDLMSAELTGLIPGAKGIPGELIGNLSDEKLGTVSINCDSGVYGQYTGEIADMPITRVAMKQEIKEGPAKIMTTLPGKDSPGYYDIIIDQINYDTSAPTRNLIIKVNDPELIECAGGIVQGMSGSPILQDGVFVAALTHVFVNDPTMGYGIFAENMLTFANDANKSTSNAA